MRHLKNGTDPFIASIDQAINFLLCMNLNLSCYKIIFTLDSERRANVLLCTFYIVVDVDFLALGHKYTPAKRTITMVSH